MDTGLDDRRRRAAKELLRLLTGEERKAVCKELGFSVPDGLKPKAEIDAMAAELSGLPRHRVLAELLNVARPLASMLTEIVSFLERHGIAARTTGFALGLAHPTTRLGSATIDLSQQEVGMICSWPTKALRKLGDDPFEESHQAWLELSLGWEQLLRRSTTRVIPGRFDPVATALARHRTLAEGRIDPEPWKHEPDLDATDDEAQKVLRHLLERVEQTLAILQRIPAADRAASAQELMWSLDELVVAATRALGGRPAAQLQGDQVDAEALDETLETYRQEGFPTIDFFEDFDRFEEDIRALADLEEADSFLDALRLDLWSNRPQLFEVWVLVRILDWIDHRGYEVELLNVEPSPTGRSVWQLKYSGDSQPCAQVIGGGRTEFLFYQLFQAGRGSEEGGAMPDLALLRGKSGRAQRVWAIDPKLSTTYGPADYKETARRYRTDFEAPLAIVVEYFPRSRPNPSELLESAWLVTDASPSGSGFPHVLDKIAECHPPLTRIVICIDMSSSFDASRSKALHEAAAALAGQIDDVADVYVCFAGSAQATTGMRAFLRSGGAETLPVPRLNPGTALGPLIDELRKVMPAHAPTRVEMISDGEFAESGWTDRMATQLGTEVHLRA